MSDVISQLIGLQTSASCRSHGSETVHIEHGLLMSVSSVGA